MASNDGAMSNECWLMGWHENCIAPEWCSCLCHVDAEDIDWDAEWSDG